MVAIARTQSETPLTDDIISSGTWDCLTERERKAVCLLEKRLIHTCIGPICIQPAAYMAVTIGAAISTSINCIRRAFDLSDRLSFGLLVVGIDIYIVAALNEINDVVADCIEGAIERAGAIDGADIAQSAERLPVQQRETQSHFGSFLRRHRESLGLSKSDFAKLAKVNIATLTRVEHLHAPKIHKATAYKIAKSIGYSNTDAMLSAWRSGAQGEAHAS